MKGPGPTATLPLVEVQHDRVRSLFVEASRRTGTPGVVQDASSRAVAELSRHVAAESAVIDALVRTKLGDDVADVWTADLAGIREAAARLPRGVDDPDDPLLGALAELTERHVALFDDVIAPGLRRTAAQELAASAVAYAAATEAASDRPPPRPNVSP